MNILYPHTIFLTSPKVSRLFGPMPKYNPKFTIDFFFAISIFSFSLSGVVIGGTLLGMSRTVVTPPCAAAFDPLVQSSL